MQDALSFLPPRFKMNPTWNKADYKFNFSDVNFFDDFNISDVYKGDDFNISDMNVDDDFNISDIDYALFLGCGFVVYFLVGYCLQYHHYLSRFDNDILNCLNIYE